ncbi:unnamed protein product [Moneuplotes crassus]|uniref:LITAF domain-containing protein n=1 Tax=Euplotes crassus TaxID=5936 RepID=A0AAD1XPG2_EUPCR|nr:unnamed protein product [Moneuplotes crassus]
MMDGQQKELGGPPPIATAPPPPPPPSNIPAPQPYPATSAQDYSNTPGMPPQPHPQEIQAPPPAQQQYVQPQIQPPSNYAVNTAQPVDDTNTTTSYQVTNANVAPQGPVAPKPNPAMFRGVITSVYCECPSCGQATHTRVEHDYSAMQWIICLIMFIVGLWLCCCIPFCIDSMRSGNHYCSNCGSSIGVIQGSI